MTIRSLLAGSTPVQKTVQKLSENSHFNIIRGPGVLVKTRDSIEFEELTHWLGQNAHGLLYSVDNRRKFIFFSAGSVSVPDLLRRVEQELSAEPFNVTYKMVN